ncbi:hypothetical protein BEL04_01215 [Mucilaginibacter sp. PPCGB 2223]|uniref:hypothetical protein n=1 Tax=Mucilaginibacter sp. PPCGB 2223 TaxID=1886027 RepID=UPI00082574BD|nr:hypothetical protein [Mucilaginibacter sp. PPCGB 2223]OCX52976.1 hypothetical protein BEL04_01215 [Mucilaginibacter sp. PPCGB 2223]
MDHYREIRNTLAWHNEGKFEVELVNGVITKLNFCEPGKGPHDTGQCLTSTNFKFLQAVYSSLGDLFTFIEEENRRLGYSYARPDETQHSLSRTGDSNYPENGETIIRPLISYEHEPEVNNQTVEQNKLRDIG